jgi:hypothetical protein
VIVVGFVSCYAEGRLVRAAIDSVLDVELDRLYVFDGPAGDPLDEELELELELEPHLEACLERWQARTELVVHRGRWRTDGRKRDAMLQRCKQDFPGGPVWAVTVDADEVLVNGRYLRDRLEWLVANDRRRGASTSTPDNPPMARWPLHLVEHEGSMSLITARVYRVDLLRSIDHSSSVVTNVAGVQDGWGNYAASSAEFTRRWFEAVDRGAMIAWPPLPCEPHLVHRSNLRHPARAALRMSKQEQREFERAQELERRREELHADADANGSSTLLPFERRPDLGHHARNFGGEERRHTEFLTQNPPAVLDFERRLDRRIKPA